MYIQGQLDLGFGQVKPEPHLSFGQVDFKIFSYPELGVISCFGLEGSSAF